MPLMNAWLTFKRSYDKFFRRSFRNLTPNTTNSDKKIQKIFLLVRINEESYSKRLNK